MSGYLEAKEDGIKIVKYGKHAEFTHFIIPCFSCGNQVDSTKYVRNKQYKCPICKANEKKQFSTVRMDRMFERAMSVLKPMFVFRGKEEFKKYQDAALIIKQRIDNGMIFASKEEILVAIELTKNSVEFELHKKVLGYELDFYLPDEHLNIEVDGILYHQFRVNDDLKRDLDLSKSLGDDFKTIRILDKSINHSVIDLMCIIHGALIENTLHGNYITDDDYYLRSLEFRYE